MWWQHVAELVALLALAALAVYLGWRAADARPALGALAGVFGLLALGSFFLDAIWLHAPFPIGCLPEAVTVLGLTLIGSAARTADTPRARIPLGVLVVMMLYFVLGGPVCLLTDGPVCAAFDGRQEHDPRLPLQSSGWTCGPACAASMLRLRGVDISEGQMAARCRTTSFGTGGARLFRGLRAAAVEHGLTVRPRLYHSQTTAQLARLPLPAVASVVVTGIPHVVLVLRVDDQGRLVVADPLISGQPIAYTAERFAEKYEFLGRAITLE